MVSCSSQEPAYSGNPAAALPLHAKGVYPSSCPGLGSRFTLSTGCITQQPREYFCPLHTCTSFHGLCASLCYWNPDVRKSFPCFPSWLGITNPGKENHHIHACHIPMAFRCIPRGKSMLVGLVAPRAGRICPLQRSLGKCFVGTKGHVI